MTFLIIISVRRILSLKSIHSFVAIYKKVLAIEFLKVKSFYRYNLFQTHSTFVKKRLAVKHSRFTKEYLFL